MYLFPSNLLKSGEINATYKNYPSFCVPDCPTANFQTVNNPELGRCEFLGYYCMAGNYKDGCLRSYLENCKLNNI